MNRTNATDHLALIEPPNLTQPNPDPSSTDPLTLTQPEPTEPYTNQTPNKHYQMIVRGGNIQMGSLPSEEGEP